MNAKEHLEKAEQALSAAEEIMRGEAQFHPGETDPITRASPRLLVEDAIAHALIAVGLTKAT
jgi:hypothetical protein